LQRLFQWAKLGKRAQPHMLRDIFAVKLLLAGVPIDQVSILLGHASVETTERHAPFVKARQEQLLSSVEESWKLQGLQLVKIPNSEFCVLVVSRRSPSRTAGPACDWREGGRIFGGSWRE
jgi:integrase-like protein